MILTESEMHALCQSRATGHAFDCCCHTIRATERAVLEKLREPTREMLDAADGRPEGHAPWRKFVDHRNRYVWLAMIDAATKAG